MADARELRKAFLNLILNGMEALAPGGRMTVGTAWASGDRAVVVTIEDTGAGMNEETLAKLFDLFYTTKPEGTGLGMAIARSVVDRHSGTLAVDSAPGRGTRVTVRLPLEVSS
jgi:two-component system sensor histidine kinase AtoS